MRSAIPFNKSIKSARFVCVNVNLRLFTRLISIFFLQVKNVFLLVMQKFFVCIFFNFYKKKNLLILITL